MTIFIEKVLKIDGWNYQSRASQSIKISQSITRVILALDLLFLTVLGKIQNNLVL